MNFLQKQNYNRQQLLNQQDYAVINTNQRAEVHRRISGNLSYQQWYLTYEQSLVQRNIAG